MSGTNNEKLQDHKNISTLVTYLALQSAHSLFSGNLRSPSRICKRMGQLSRNNPITKITSQFIWFIKQRSGIMNNSS